MFKRCRCSLTCSEYFSNALINGLVTSSLEQANAVKEKFCRFGETQESCGNNYGYRVFSLETTSHSSQLWIKLKRLTSCDKIELRKLK